MKMLIRNPGTAGPPDCGFMLVIDSIVAGNGPDTFIEK
jgi:hypothetical protein